jgi:hypothetical protein
VDLERIRNNQRRSRARRTDYIAELEDKIRRYEIPSSQIATDKTVQLLTSENDPLRKLLQSLGLGNDFLKAYVNASALALDMSKAGAQQHLQSQIDGQICCGHKNSSSPMSSKVSVFPMLNDFMLKLTHSRKVLRLFKAWSHRHQVLWKRI